MLTLMPFHLPTTPLIRVNLSSYLCLMGKESNRGMHATSSTSSFPVASAVDQEAPDISNALCRGSSSSAVGVIPWCSLSTST